MARKRAWVRYVEEEYETTLRSRRGRVRIEDLTPTQSEIELVKYEMVRHEGYRVGEPILVYKGRYGKTFIVDGHTRARVRLDMGESTIEAEVFSSREVGIDAELMRMAETAGGGTPMTVEAIPVVDRLGESSEAWHRRRKELFDAWHRRSAEGDSQPT